LQTLAEKTIVSINFAALCAHATAVRKRYDKNEVPCKIDSTRYQYGLFNVVFEVGFEDAIFWIVRIQLSSGEADGSDPSQSAVLKSEVDSMRYIKSHTTIPLPEVYDCNLNLSSDSNCVGH